MRPLKSVEMTRGRVFVATLETGEAIRTSIEGFCRDNGVRNAKVTIIGGMASGSSFVCGPVLEGGKETAPIRPITSGTEGPTEFHGSGTVFPDADGNPKLHLHGSLGREGSSSTGCFREGAVAWLTMEIIIEELIGEGAGRVQDSRLGV